MRQLPLGRRTLRPKLQGDHEDAKDVRFPENKREGKRKRKEQVLFELNQLWLENPLRS